MIFIAYEKFGFDPSKDLIGKGAFGSVYQGFNTRTREKVAIKVEPIEYNLKLLKNETKIYDFLKGTRGIPQVKWFGLDKVNYYMVMDLFSVSLETKLKQSKNKKFSLDLCFQLGRQALLILESIHSRGIIHRDIKPDNFVLGSEDRKDKTKTNQIYLIDFGLCRTYQDSFGNHIPEKPVNSLIGSAKFASIQALKSMEQSRRDDLESLGYMLCYFNLGELDDFTIDFKQSQLLEKVPLQLKLFLEKVWSFEFSQAPQYNLLRDLLQSTK